MPIEVERVLNDLYPLLRTVQPAELNYTLNALADALEGRGDKIGESLETLDGYLKKMNPQLPALIDDIKLLATVTDTYADVFPRAGGDPAQHREDGQHAGLQGAAPQRRSSRTRRRSPTPPRSSWTPTATTSSGSASSASRSWRCSALLAQLPLHARGHRPAGPAAGRHLPRVPLPHQPARRSRSQPRGYTAADRPFWAPTTRPTAPACPTRPSRTTPRAGLPEPERRRRQPRQG